MQASPHPSANLVLAAVEHEKARISRDLHDELVQLLFAARLDCAWVKQNLGRDPQAACDRLASMQRLLEGSAASVRRIVADLRPAPLDEAGFAGALERLTLDFAKGSGVRCDLEVAPQISLPELHARAAFRIVQEALANVRKHAGASHAKVTVVLSGGVLSLSVRDDGRGFLTAVPGRSDAMGLAGLRERARLLGGWLDVCSAPGAGTLVAARLVIPRDADEGDGTRRTWPMGCSEACSRREDRASACALSATNLVCSALAAPLALFGIVLLAALVRSGGGA